MRKELVTTAFVLATIFAGTAQARDPCKTLMCMAGKAKLDGSSIVGDTCDEAVDDFYSIVVKKHGDFKASATAKAREDFINSCPGSDENQKAVSVIISMFGTAR